jgi:perosamine synthetase
MTSPIPYTKPSITDLEVRYATDAAANGWGAQCYDYIHRFEAAFRDHLGVSHAVATSSCTGAMELGLAALGIGPGDEVILADTNWVATAAPIVHLGATPVFVDILPDSWCIDPEAARAAITPRSKAIVATHLYGNLCDMEALSALATANDLALVEDAAEAIGSVYHGQRAGSLGTFGTFSFHGTKTMTTGEGGMFVTNDDALFEKVQTLANHGRSMSQTKQFWADVVGYKFKMSNIQAALGCAQLERIEDLIAQKYQIFAHYRDALASIERLSMNVEPEGCRIGAWMPTLVFDHSVGVTRDDLITTFKSHDIDARVFFWPLSGLPMFEDVSTNKIAWDIPGRAINLPSFHDMTTDQMNRVIAVITGVIAKAAP